MSSAVSILFDTCNQLLSLVLFKRPNEPTLDTLSKPTLEARRKAATTFIYLCDTLPDKLVQHVPMLIVAVKDMFGQLLDSEKIYLIEALASVSNGMKSFEAQAQYLSQLLANVEEEWLAPAVQECCTTIDQFLTTLNIHPQATPAQREQNAPVCKAKRGVSHSVLCRMVTNQAGRQFIGWSILFTTFGSECQCHPLRKSSCRAGI